MDTNTLSKGTLFPPEVVKEIMSKVRGYSTLAKLSAKTPLPFAGTDQFVFNLEGNAQIVGEGEQKLAGKAILKTVAIKPVKFVYQARVTDEFMYAAEEVQLNHLKAFGDGFAKKIAEAFDLAAIHGLEPRSMTDASFKATNSFDGQVTGNLVTFDDKLIEDNIEAAITTVRAKGNDVTGIAMSLQAGQALSKVKINGVPQYPEYRFGQNPPTFYGMTSDINKTLTTVGGTADKDHVIVGDFQNMFRWGYAKDIPVEVIEYGDPDGSGRDLKAYNEVCLRSEAFIGWGILDTDAFARVKE